MISARKMKVISFLLSFLIMVSLTNIDAYAVNGIAKKSNNSLTIHTVISGDPSVILTANANITLSGMGKNISLDKTKIMSGSTVVQNVTAGTYQLKTKNIQTAGYSVVITLNGVETTSVNINPKTNSKLTIEMCYTKQKIEDLPHDNLNAEKETDFYNPVNGKYRLMFQDDKSMDDSVRLQQAIDKVNQNGGGTLIIKKGTYYIANINMKSNVHIKVLPDVTFHLGDATPAKPNSVKEKKASMFIFDDDEWIQNVSIEANDSNKKYTINLDTGKYETTYAFSCNSVRNFKISDANILGDYKAYQKVGVGPGSVNGKSVVPNNGVISNISSSNVLYGYGLVQIQAGENLLFKDLSSVGGVTLRIENGFIQHEGNDTPRVNDIYGRNISCKNGHFAFMCEDHGIPIGYFNVQGIHAESCMAAVEVASGNSDSVVKQVTAIYGENAQIKTKDMSKLPVELTTSKLIIPDDRDPINFGRPTPLVYKGPAIAAVILTSKSRITFDDSEVKLCKGFKYQTNGGKVLRLKPITLIDGTVSDPTKLSISGLKDSYKYTGSKITPDIRISYNGVLLQANKDYMVEYKNNVGIGTASILIEFKREYTGNLTKTFKIAK